MSIESLSSSTQYNDWQGDIALDDMDFNGIRNYLDKKLGIKDIVVGIDTYFHGEHLNSEITVKAYITNEELEEKYKVIKFDIKLEEFFKLFKRVHLTASRKNQLKGKTIETIELS
ncbi:hypothetical protein [Acinetobacter sp. AR2-3]|uniref:hypothetical protein n=1 Tax=Acinetobacter sp. AR2-3 TaxID=1891969 RepID=UPI0009003783|nr:hypothetical protein [Acinetobacter sp. AR2-3]OIU85030.1 hypothetical protein BFN00_08895 [Acinetobacter sp. AR2-3]